MSLDMTVSQANLTDGQSDLVLELARLNDQYTDILTWQDIVVRALHNPHISPYNFRLFVSLIDTYPDLLSGDGQRREIEVNLVRKNAGEMKESSATRFFRDLSTIGRIIYEAGFDKTMGRRRSFVTPLPEFPYVEDYDTNSTERKRNAREAEEKRKKQFKNPLQIMQCEECGSNNISWDATCRCLDCKHEHAPIKDIPASMITIEAEVIELADDVFFAPTEKIPVPSTPIPAAIQEELPQTPVPVRILGMHSRGIACPDCGSLHNFYQRRTDYGTVMDICAVCDPWGECQ